MSFGASERVSERMSAAERAGETSSGVQANERTEERMARYSTCQFDTLSAQCGLLLSLTDATIDHW